MSGEGGFGPWAANLEPDERLARTRALRALVFVYCGHDHPLARALLEAERDPDAAPAALAELDALPALRRRQILATYAALARAARRDPAAPLTVGTCRGGQALSRRR